MAIQILDNPIDLFDQWFNEAKNHPHIPDATAMFLATANKKAQPSVRAVLLKEHDANGFIFYTNFESQKGQEILENPYASLVFYWEPIGKQIRIQGSVTPVSDEEAEQYFQSRAWKSKIGAWASQQSRPMKSMKTLKKRVAQYMAKFAMRKIPRPPYWSGFRIHPERIEFWLNGAYRLHERVVYTQADTKIKNKKDFKKNIKMQTDQWVVQRLFP